MKPSRSLNAALTTALLLDGTLAATSGQLNVLSMNVAGLPAILNSNDVPGDKATNAATIGSKFAASNYEVIHVQEVSHETNLHPRFNRLLGFRQTPTPSLKQPARHPNN